MIVWLFSLFSGPFPTHGKRNSSNNEDETSFFERMMKSQDDRSTLKERGLKK
jgi:hypothetical protein